MNFKREMEKFHTERKLGNERPIHLLCKIKVLWGKQLNDDFQQNLWMQRMPTHIQTVLSASSENLDQLAVIVDKDAEVAQPNTICAASSAQTPLNVIGIITEVIAKQIEELTRQVSELLIKITTPCFQNFLI